MLHRATMLRELLVVTGLFVACAPTAPAGQNPASGQVAAPQAAAISQKQMVIAFATEPQMLEPSFGQGSGNRDFSALTSGFLTYLTPQQQAMPYLAQELPSLDRGTWKVLPDGRMETTYTLRRNLTWHDGHALTAHDFVFGHTMHLDPAMPAAKIDVDRRIGRVQALDDYTIFLDWKEPYLWAGMIFEPNFPALPRHILEDLYNNDKQAFVDSAHWRTEFIGTGPYKLEGWQQGVDMTLLAFDGFALGKPPIDKIVMRFIADANTIVANLLTGTVDVAFHSSIAFSENQGLEQRGWAGHVEYWRGNPRWLEFQTRDWGNIQKAVLDARVRRALVHAIDRRAIVDGLYSGKTQVQYYWLSADDPAYQAVDRAVPKYEYDVRQAEILLQEAGWIKGSDGVARNTAGDSLSIPILNQSGDIDQLEAAILVDFWKAIGASGEIQRLSRAQQADGEFRSKYQAVTYNRRPLGYDTMGWLSSNVTTAENRWGGDNMSGYHNPTLDQLWPRVLATIDAKDREPLLINALTAMTNDAVINPTHLQPRSMVYRSGITGPQEPWVGESALIWNAWEWRWTQ